jgi:hypothetical protein
LSVTFTTTDGTGLYFDSAETGNWNYSAETGNWNYYATGTPSPLPIYYGIDWATDTPDVERRASIRPRPRAEPAVEGPSPLSTERRVRLR